MDQENLKQIVEVVLKKEKGGLGKVFITALITAVLTSITTVIFTNYSLKREQSYWKNRFVAQTILNERSSKFEKVNKINTHLQDLELLGKKIKLEKIDIYKEMCEKERKKKLKNLNYSAFEYQKILSQTISQLEIISLEFDGRVSEIAEGLNDAFKQQYDYGIIEYEDIANNNPEKYFKNDGDSFKEFNKIKIELIEKMCKSISYELDLVPSLINMTEPKTKIDIGDKVITIEE